MNRPADKSGDEEPFSTESVREALRHVDDIIFLSNHPLSEYLERTEALAEKQGERLRREIFRALEYLDLADKQSLSSDIVRLSTQCLHLQYIEKLPIKECCEKLNIEQAYFHRMRNFGLSRFAEALKLFLVDTAQAKAALTKIVVKRTFDLNKPHYWANIDTITEIDGGLRLTESKDEHYFADRLIGNLSNFFVEWIVHTEGRSALFVVGTEERFYWIALNARERWIRFQAVTNGSWDDFGQFFFQTSTGSEPSIVTFERFDGQIRVKIDHERIPLYRRGEFDDTRSLPSSDLGMNDLLFGSELIPLKVGFGCAVAVGESTQVDVVALTVIEIEKETVDE